MMPFKFVLFYVFALVPRFRVQLSTQALKTFQMVQKKYKKNTSSKFNEMCASKSYKNLTIPIYKSKKISLKPESLYLFKTK